MSTSLAGAVEVDDQLTPASSCGLLEARERLAKGLGWRGIFGFSLEVENWGRRGVYCSMCVEEDGWLVLVLFIGLHGFCCQLQQLGRELQANGRCSTCGKATKNGRRGVGMSVGGEEADGGRQGRQGSVRARRAGFRLK